MSTPQQILFAETILAVKKAIKREACESDSDEEVSVTGNRGEKTKKRARFTQRGQLAPSSGPESYKRSVEYAGVCREIISENPPRVDDDGYEVESDEENTERLEEAAANSALENPYSDVVLENILAPLTAVTDLPTHPILSRPFTTNTLTSLMHQSNDIMRKENASLWRVKRLVAGFCGDYMWIPCGVLLGDNDKELYKTNIFPEITEITKAALAEGRAISGLPPIEEDTPNGTDKTNGNNKYATPVPEANGKDVEMTDVDNGTEKSGKSSKKPQVGGAMPNGTTEDPEYSVHPFFAAPLNARPDKNMGLPDAEAEEMRRLLQAYVQKQEEVCRGARKLFEGLLKAQRLRQTVMTWARTEAHCGPDNDMSDEEDWYDKEYLGITDDLKKGQDEEEEDTTTTKKTRNRK
ncbi:hypothetical protein TD95_000425 [Thielaviopsis punctulata]|uniref:Transcriptional regulatory protein RXT2 N-terminal domain-containing protein n=1 Tax=Thielaviopsis punctulata TaxID=72032 RepID=A0A0F4ZGV7_9PEZI|nr:hypothetical protein TD95_000425 [Thielaviopsis punctulata]